MDNLDDVVKVERINLDDFSELSADDWSIPSNPPQDESTPYTGSSLVTTFEPNVKLVAIMVEKKGDVVEDIKFSLTGKSNRGDTAFTPIENADGGAIFTGKTYSYIFLPNDLGPIALLSLRIIQPTPTSEYRVKFFGCAGKEIHSVSFYE